MSYINYPATFDGIDLTSVPGLTVLSTDPYKMPRRNVSMSELARTNKSKVNSAFYIERIITVRVGITRATRNLLENSIDTLMGYLQGVNKLLVLNQSSGSRQYYCTLEDAPVAYDGGSYIELSLTFTCTDRFGYDVAPTLLLDVVAYTSASKVSTLAVGGNAPWQVPVITLRYTAVGGGTTKTVSIGNDSTGQVLSVTRTWIAGDVLVIGTFNKTVKVNNAEVDFDGAIPEWAPGVGYMTYSDNFTSRTFNLQAVYNKRWT